MFLAGADNAPTPMMNNIFYVEIKQLYHTNFIFFWFLQFYIFFLLFQIQNVNMTRHNRTQYKVTLY